MRSRHISSMLLFVSMLLTSMVVAQAPDPKPFHESNAAWFQEQHNVVIAEHLATVDEKIKDAGKLNWYTHYAQPTNQVVHNNVTIEINVVAQNNNRNNAFMRPVGSIMPKMYQFTDYSKIAGPLYCNSYNSANVIHVSDFNDYRNIYGVRMYVPPSN